MRASSTAKCSLEVLSKSGPTDEVQKEVDREVYVCQNTSYRCSKEFDLAIRIEHLRVVEYVRTNDGQGAYRRCQQEKSHTYCNGHEYHLSLVTNSVRGRLYVHGMACSFGHVDHLSNGQNVGYYDDNCGQDEINRCVDPGEVYVEEGRVASVDVTAESGILDGD